MASSDPRPTAVIKDKALLKSLHLRWRECAICGEVEPLSLHHIHKHPRDDVEGNLVMVCGSGTTGCHGRIESRDPVVLRLLFEHIVGERPDVVAYLRKKLGRQWADAWLGNLAGSTI